MHPGLNGILLQDGKRNAFVTWTEINATRPKLAQIVSFILFPKYFANKLASWISLPCWCDTDSKSLPCSKFGGQVGSGEGKGLSASRLNWRHAVVSMPLAVMALILH